MGSKLSYKEIEKYAQVMTKSKVKCKCSHKVNIPAYLDRVICDWCKNYVYRTPELEEEYKKKDFERKLKKYMKESEQKINGRK